MLGSKTVTFGPRPGGAGGAAPAVAAPTLALRRSASGSRMSERIPVRRIVDIGREPTRLSLHVQRGLTDASERRAHERELALPAVGGRARRDDPAIGVDGDVVAEVAGPMEVGGQGAVQRAVGPEADQ